MEPATGSQNSGSTVSARGSREPHQRVARRWRCCRQRTSSKRRELTSPTSAPASRIFRRPEHIKRAAIKALDENRTKYTATPGIAPLRAGDLRLACRSNLARPTSRPSAIVTVGGKHAIFNAVCSLINPGDEVVIPAPYWVSYPDIVKYAGGKPVFVPTRAEDDFILRAADLEKAITSRTRMVIANSPCNPTGAVIPPDEFAKILAVCQRHGVWLLSDECYSHFTYGDCEAIFDRQPSECEKRGDHRRVRSRKPSR